MYGNNVKTTVLIQGDVAQVGEFQRQTANQEKRYSESFLTGVHLYVQPALFLITTLADTHDLDGGAHACTPPCYLCHCQSSTGDVPQVKK